MKTLKLSGYPKVTSPLHLPDAQALLRIPWYQYASAEEVLNTGGILYDYLLANAPLASDYKYILITSRVQFLTPGNTAIKYAEDWHTDSNGEPFNSNDLVHLMVSPCTALTQFNVNPVETTPLDEDITQAELNTYLNANANHLNLYGQSIPSNCYVTFDHTHAHQAISPVTSEFRFMLRIIQTNDYTPSPKGRVTRSYTYCPYDPNTDYPTGITIENGIVQLPNIDQTPKGVFLYT
jgi:hypothetical protein